MLCCQIRLILLSGNRNQHLLQMQTEAWNSQGYLLLKVKRVTSTLKHGCCSYIKTKRIQA